MTKFKVVDTVVIEREVIQTDSKDPVIDVMMVSGPVYPIIDARQVSKWFKVTEEKAEDILEDLFVRHHLWRAEDKKRGLVYCESCRELGLSDADMERQRKSRIACCKKRLSKE